MLEYTPQIKGTSWSGRFAQGLSGKGPICIDSSKNYLDVIKIGPDVIRVYKEPDDSYRVEIKGPNEKSILESLKKFESTFEL